MIVIVPDYLQKAIYKKVDAALQECCDTCPDAQKERDIFYRQMLDFVDKHGFLPDFHIEKGEDHDL